MGTYALVAGRDCGDCTVCCIVPAIDDPDIQKRSGTPCRHCRAHALDGRVTDSAAPGCTAYDTRPGVCRSFHCAWRYLADLDDGWRPDRSQVYATLEEIPLKGASLTAVTLTLIGDAAATARLPWFVNFVHARALAEKPMFFALPGSPGLRPTRIFAPLADMAGAARKGAAAVQSMLEQAVAVMARQPKDAHVLKHSGHDVSAEH